MCITPKYKRQASEPAKFSPLHSHISLFSRLPPPIMTKYISHPITTPLIKVCSVNLPSYVISMPQNSGMNSDSKQYELPKFHWPSMDVTEVLYSTKQEQNPLLSKNQYLYSRTNVPMLESEL